MAEFRTDGAEPSILSGTPLISRSDEAAALQIGTPNRFEDLRNDVAEGLMYSHSRENANTSKVLEVASFSYALIELLSERGLISIEELDQRKRKVGQRLVEKFAEKGMGVALTDHGAGSGRRRGQMGVGSPLHGSPRRRRLLPSPRARDEKLRYL